MPITHAFVSGYADSADKTLVKPSDWNAEHVGTSLDLQVNGTDNQSQTLLNLVPVNGATVTDNGSGNVAVGVGMIQESQVSGLTADLASKAPLASPALTGTPTAPTPANGNNSSQIATTAFVEANAGALAPVQSVAGKTGNVLLVESDIANLPADLAAKAPLVSPAFTGTPTAPTAPTGDNSAALATTAFVQAARAIQGVTLLTANYTVTAADNGKFFVIGVSGGITITLPNPAPASNFVIWVANPTPGTLQVNPNGLQMDGASGNLTVGKNQGAMIGTDATNYYSERGMGSGGGGGFTAGGDLSGTSTLQTVIGLEGKPLDVTTVGAPSDGQVIAWSAASGKYEAVTPASGGLPSTAPNQVIAGPASGTTAATAAPRSLVAADIPGTLNPTGIGAAPASGYDLDVTSNAANGGTGHFANNVQIDGNGVASGNAALIANTIEGNYSISANQPLRLSAAVDPAWFIRFDNPIVSWVLRHDGHLLEWGDSTTSNDFRVIFGDNTTFALQANGAVGVGTAPASGYDLDVTSSAANGGTGHFAKSIEVDTSADVPSLILNSSKTGGTVPVLSIVQPDQVRTMEFASPQQTFGFFLTGTTLRWYYQTPALAAALDIDPAGSTLYTSLDIQGTLTAANGQFINYLTAPTPPLADSSTNVATTAFVHGAITSLPASVPATRQVLTAAPLTGGGDLSADRTLAISVFGASGASHATGSVPDPGATAGTTRFLREDATWAAPPSGTGGGTSITFNGV